MGVWVWVSEWLGEPGVAHTVIEIYKLEKYFNKQKPSQKYTHLMRERTFLKVSI